MFRGGVYVAEHTLRGESVLLDAEGGQRRAGRSEIPLSEKSVRTSLTS